MPGRARHRRRRGLREAASCSGRACARSRSRRALGRFSARHLSPARARSCSSRPPATRSPASTSAPVYDPGAPCTIEVELAAPDDADPYRHRAGVDPHRPAHDRAHGAHVVGRLARDLPLSSAEVARGPAITVPSSRSSATVTGGRSRSAARCVAERESGGQRERGADRAGLDRAVLARRRRRTCSAVGRRCPAGGTRRP